jgi:hypothetical protein
MTFVNSSYAPESDVSGDCRVAAAPEPGKNYIIFSREIRNRQFLPVISPVPRTKDFVSKLKKLSVCKKCGQLHSLFFDQPLVALNQSYV